MKMTLESTDRFVDVNGARCRVWEGKSERGTPVYAFVAQVAVDKGHDATELDVDLQENRPPTVVWPLRMLID